MDDAKPKQKDKKRRKKRRIPDPADSTMSLGDHLEDLRARLIHAIIGLLVGTGICLVFGTRIIRFIQRPYIKVLRSMAADENPEEADPNAPPAPSDEDLAQLQTLSPADGFVSYVKIALISGLLLSSPWVFYQIWMFVAAGLYEHERRYVYIATPFSATLFVTGALFFVLVVAPITIGFLVKFNASVINARSNFTFANYMSFIAMLMLVFGIAFQTPIAIYFLNRTGLVSIAALRRSRKFVFLAVFIVGAMVTPPDFISQVTLAIPLYLLFELGIVLSYFAGRKDKLRKAGTS
jgi:sec-independent protein translocase protein TatC